ncbi:MAG TPA: hypothetical protein VGR70_01805 [Stellaceae bacterium]|nr:hypothetical protein [Stellaceae bacterium]
MDLPTMDELEGAASIVAVVVTAASAFCAATPTPDPTTTKGKIYHWIEIAGLVVGRAKESGVVRDDPKADAIAGKAVALAEDVAGGKPPGGVVTSAIAAIIMLGSLSLTGCGVVQNLKASFGSDTPIATTPATTADKTVATPLAGLAQFTANDAAQAVTDAIGTGTAAAPQYPDLYSCAFFIQQGLPQWRAQINGAVPSLNAQGAISGFVEASIAVQNAQGTISNLKAQVPAGFAHACGAALTSDNLAALQLLNQLGIKVAAATALPGIGGLLGGLVAP